MPYALPVMTRQERKELLQSTAARIKALRRAAGITQEQLSEKANVGTHYISRLENAHQVPSLYVIADLAKALGTTPSVLMGDALRDKQAGRLKRLEGMPSTLSDEDAAFVESEIEGWIAHLAQRG